MTGTSRVCRTAVGLLLATLAVGGCSAGPGRPSRSVSPAAVEPTPATAVPSPSTVGGLVVPSELRGSYRASVVGTTASEGAWKLDISASDLLLTNPIGGDPFSIDPTGIDATRMTLRSGQDCDAQRDASYTIALEGSLLIVRALEDTCADRKAVLTTTSWTRVP